MLLHIYHSGKKCFHTTRAYKKQFEVESVILEQLAKIRDGPLEFLCNMDGDNAKYRHF